MIARQRIAAMLGAAAALLAIAGCGDDDSPEHTPTPGTSSTLPADRPSPTAIVSQGSNPADCPPAHPPTGGSLLRVELTPFCVVWDDRLSGEKGFRIVLKYFGSGEVFIHDVPANATALVFPPAEAPTLTTSDGCRQRQTLEVQILAVTSAGATPVDATAMNVECMAN